MSDDFDSPWKEALDAYFEPFLASEGAMNRARIPAAKERKKMIVRKGTIG